MVIAFNIKREPRTVLCNVSGMKQRHQRRDLNKRCASVTANILLSQLIDGTADTITHTNNNRPAQDTASGSITALNTHRQKHPTHLDTYTPSTL